MRALLAALLVLAATTLAPALPAQAPATRLAIFGDDGTNPNTQANVNGALADGAQGYVGLGDYYYNDAPANWKKMFAPLTSKWAALALGNHDDYHAIKDLVGPSPTWSKSYHGARIVGINTEARMDVGSSQYATVRAAVCDAPEQLRILVMHKPWWLLQGARHPGHEFPGSATAMDQLVKDCGVDLVMAGHEHNYQRLVRNHAHYLIVGTGGQSLYPVAGSPTGTVASHMGYGRVLLDVSPTGASVQFKSLDGKVRDAFSVTSGGSPPPAPPPPAGGLTWAPRNGNEWWVQVAVGGESASAVTRVESRDTNGAWVTLPKRSWGDYAASYRVEPGHHVWFRATLTSGAVIESCPHDWPSGAPRCQSGFTASWSNARGNAWWVETDVTASGGTLAGVDARVNGGAWTPLSKQSWGSWAKSIHAPAGSTVEFRARSSDGQMAVSSGHAWPPK